MSDLQITDPQTGQPELLNVEDAPEDLPPQLLPLDAWHRARGGRMVPFAGYEMPVQYEGIMAEHLWVRESAGLFDVSHMGQLVLTSDAEELGGADAVAKALEAVLPGDVTGLGDGRMRYSLLLNEDGGILDDLMVTRRGDEVYMVVNGATKYDDIGYLLDVLPDDVTMNLGEDQALLAVQGPKAVDALARVVPGVEALVFMTAAAFQWQGADLWMSRSGYTGEDGYEISVPADQAERIWNTLLEDARVKPIGLGARDSLRLEAGLPLHGHDIDPTTSPVEGALTFALSKSRKERADFAGAERILKELTDGPSRVRVGLIVKEGAPAREGAEIADAEGNVIGKVTSGGPSPTLGKNIAMGFVPPAFAALGTALKVIVRGKTAAAEVVAMPFVAQRYYRKPKA